MSPLRPAVTPEALHRRPRLTVGLSLALATGLVTFVTWQPFADLRGAVPAITIGAGLAHGLAGALLARRLLDRGRTTSGAHAAVLGAVASVLAVLLFTPGFAWWVSHGGAPAKGESSFVALTVYLGLMSFFAGGWLLLFVSALVGWALWVRAGEAWNPSRGGS